MDHRANCNCDQCLLERLRAAGAPERRQGWEEWYLRDAAAVQSYVARRCLILHCSELGEDILQDCFLIGFRNVSSGRYIEEGAPLCSYLFGIAKWLIYDAVRRKFRAPVALSTEFEDIIEDKAASAIIENVYGEEIVTSVQAACMCLPYLERRVLERIYLDHQSSDQVAAELGKTAGNVRAIAHRAVHAVAQQLERQHDLQLSPKAIRACLEALGQLRSVEEQAHSQV